METNKRSDENKEVNDVFQKRFKDMTSKEEVPQDLKQEVFSTLETLQFVADLADLFTVKFIKSEAELANLHTVNREKKNENDVEGEKR